MAGAWFVHFNGQQQGPLPEEQVAQWVREGVIAGNDLAWREGMPQWSPVGAIPQFANDAAQTAIAIATAPLASIAIPDDPGPFHKVGTQFSVAKSRWVGKAIVSPQAAYLLKTRRMSSGVAYGGGLAGALLAAAFTAGDDDTRTCDLTDLPPAVRVQLDPKGKRTSGDVVIVRKAAVSYVKASKINGGVTLTLAGEAIKLSTGMFGFGPINRFLTGNGWLLNQELQPTEAPIHGPGFGRRPGEAKKPPSVLRRVLYVLIALGLIALVIWLRVATAR